MLFNIPTIPLCQVISYHMHVLCGLMLAWNVCYVALSNTFKLFNLVDYEMMKSLSTQIIIFASIESFTCQSWYIWFTNCLQRIELSTNHIYIYGIGYHK